MRQVLMAVMLAVCLPATGVAEWVQVPIEVRYTASISTGAVSGMKPAGHFTLTSTPPADWISLSPGSKHVIGTMTFVPEYAPGIFDYVDKSGSYPPSSHYEGASSFSLKVEITDRLSGQSATLFGGGIAYLDKFVFADIYPIVHTTTRMNFELGYRERELARDYIGDLPHLAELRLTSRPLDDTTAEISLEGFRWTETAPEPGTLALAALGLTAVSAWHFRRVTKSA
jgi:hypothetical protein